jgi:hypothetical protein
MILAHGTGSIQNPKRGKKAEAINVGWGITRELRLTE